jgi:hypothetical protein
MRKFFTDLLGVMNKTSKFLNKASAVMAAVALCITTIMKIFV